MLVIWLEKIELCILQVYQLEKLEINFEIAIAMIQCCSFVIIKIIIIKMIQMLFNNSVV